MCCVFRITTNKLATDCSFQTFPSEPATPQTRWNRFLLKSPIRRVMALGLWHYKSDDSLLHTGAAYKPASGLITGISIWQPKQEEGGRATFQTPSSPTLFPSNSESWPPSVTSLQRSSHGAIDTGFISKYHAVKGNPKICSLLAFF